MSDSPRAARKDRKRGEIVAIAREMFFKEGYAHTSMSQIAAAVGGSKGTLYAYFRSKEELLLAVVQDVVAPQPDDYDLKTMPLEFRAWLIWFGVATMKKILSYNYLSLDRLAAGEALRFPEVGRTFHAAVMANFDMGSQYFAQAMDSGVLRRADPPLAAQQFLELCAGWTLRRAIWNIQPPPSDKELREIVGDAATVFMDGYGARERKPVAKKKQRSARAAR